MSATLNTEDQPMSHEKSTDPLAYITLGAAAGAIATMHLLPREVVHGVEVATVLFAAVRHSPPLPRVAAVVAAGATMLLLVRFGIGGFLPLFPIGLFTGCAIGWRQRRHTHPGFRFLREDFFEFCGFVGVLAAFPAVLRVGIIGAPDVAGRVAFQLAFLGSFALLPMSVSAIVVAWLRSRFGSPVGIAQPVSSIEPA